MSKNIKKVCSLKEDGGVYVYIFRTQIFFVYMVFVNALSLVLVFCFAVDAVFLRGGNSPIHIVSTGNDELKHSLAAINNGPDESELLLILDKYRDTSLLEDSAVILEAIKTSSLELDTMQRLLVKVYKATDGTVTNWTRDYRSRVESVLVEKMLNSSIGDLSLNTGFVILVDWGEGKSDDIKNKVMKALEGVSCTAAEKIFKNVYDKNELALLKSIDGSYGDTSNPWTEKLRGEVVDHLMTQSFSAFVVTAFSNARP